MLLLGRCHDGMVEAEYWSGMLQYQQEGNEYILYLDPPGQVQASQCESSQATRILQCAKNVTDVRWRLSMGGISRIVGLAVIRTDASTRRGPISALDRV